MSVRSTFSGSMMATGLAAWLAVSPARAAQVALQSVQHVMDHGAPALGGRTALQASADPFVGQWKLITLSDEMKVTSVGANTYAFDFGGAVETIVVDGTDQRAGAGTTLSVAATGPNWKVVRKRDGRTLLTANWTLSKDGNTLRDHFTQFASDGSPSTVDYVYARKAGGSGFAGTWVSTVAALGAVILLQVRPYDGNGLSLIKPSQGDTTNVIFDGKDHPGAVARSALLARRPSARAVDIIQTSDGKVTLTRQMELSPDLNRLTMTVHITGDDEPRIYVFERQ